VRIGIDSKFFASSITRLKRLRSLGWISITVGQGIDRGLQIGNPRWRDFQREGRVVAGQHNAVAVGDDAAVGYDGNQRNAVVFGSRLVEVMLDNLKPDKTPDQQTEGEQDDSRREAKAKAETIKIAIGIVEITHACLPA
jgi:hypothetical protein